MSDPGMGPNPSRVRRDWEGGCPEGQLPSRAPHPLIGRRRVGGNLGQWDWGSENAGMKAICLLYDTLGIKNNNCKFDKESKPCVTVIVKPKTR